MITGDNIPDNVQSPDPTWTFVIILAIIIAILIILIFVILFLHAKEINKLRDQFENGLTTNETNLLLQYRKLNEREKKIINETIKTIQSAHYPQIPKE